MHSRPTILRAILQKNNATNISFGELQKVTLEHTNSQLVQSNNGQLWCFTGTGLEGLFRKDNDPTIWYGRQYCDSVKDIFSCGGFFTSDELPRYGISRENIRDLYAQMDKQKNDGTIIFITAYDKNLGEQIRDYIIKNICNDFSESLSQKYPITDQTGV